MKLSLKTEREIKSSSDKQNLMAFIASKSALQEILKEVLQRGGKWYSSEIQMHIKKAMKKE